MPLFKLESATDVKLTSVTPRAEHHGKDLVSAITLGLELTGPNTMLDLLSPTLRHALYTRADDETQEALDGIEPPTPKLRTKHLGALPLSIPAIEGGTLFVEWGIGEDMSLGTCKVDKFRAECMEGGTVTLSFRASTNDIDEEEAGHLFGKLGQVIAIRFEPPVPKTEPVKTGQVIDGTKGPGAGLFDGPEDSDSEGGDPDAKTPEQALAEAVQKPADEPTWPFPAGSKPAEGEKPTSGPKARSEPAPKNTLSPVAAWPLPPKQDVAPAPAKQRPAAKYRDPDTGATWSGRGLKPMWLRVALERGRSLADFVVAGATA